MNLAREILDANPDNPVALQELGLHHAMNYRWFVSFIAVKQPVGRGLRASATNEFNAAYSYLMRAIEVEPTSLPAHRELIRLLVEEGELDLASDLASRLTKRAPDLPEGWLYRGFIAQLKNDSNLAEDFFTRALEAMPGESRAAYADPSVFLSKAEAGFRDTSLEAYDSRYWASRDPLLLTPENERHADHLARQVYTDLWYGSESTRGWQTERGEIVLRYGIPLSDYSFTSGFSRINVLDFGEFEFAFRDATRGGHYTLYSPKAGIGSSWAFDYVIKAGEMALEMPERYKLRHVPETPVVVKTTAFKGRDGLTDLYVHYAIPTQHFSLPGLLVSQTSQVGCFLTDSDGKVIASSRGLNTGVVDTEFDRPYFVGTHAVSVPPGNYGVSVEYLNGDDSAYGAYRDSAHIDVWREQLSISGVLLVAEIDAGPGSSEVGGAIDRSGYSISPDPWLVLESSGEAMIYFEIYGLSIEEGGSRYRVDARLTRNEGRGLFKTVLGAITGRRRPRSVSVSFENEATGSDDSAFFVMALSEQPEGAHTLSLEVADLVSQAVVRREVEVQVGSRRIPVGAEADF